MGALQNDATSNREAWQATTDKLADVAGQVGVQSVQILRNQDEVNQLLVRTERVAIPFELLHGADPQLIGPVHLELQSTNQKTQRYTLCVYVQTSCLELKGQGHLRSSAIRHIPRFSAARSDCDENIERRNPRISGNSTRQKPPLKLVVGEEVALASLFQRIRRQARFDALIPRRPNDLIE